MSELSTGCISAEPGKPGALPSYRDMQQCTSKFPGDWKSGTHLTAEPHAQLGFSPGSGTEVATCLPQSNSSKEAQEVFQQVVPRRTVPPAQPGPQGQETPGWAGGKLAGLLGHVGTTVLMQGTGCPPWGLPTSGLSRHVGSDNHRVTWSCAPGIKRNLLMVFGDGRRPAGSTDSGCFHTFSLIPEEKGSCDQGAEQTQEIWILNTKVFFRVFLCDLWAAEAGAEPEEQPAAA